jgi:hypothetical protein
VSGNGREKVHLLGSEIARLVRSAEATLGDPADGQYAIIGGLAVLCRCTTADRVTSDIDTVSGDTEHGALVSKDLGVDGDPASEVTFDVIDTFPISAEDLEGLSEKHQLFLAAHRWALESAGLLDLEVAYREEPSPRIHLVQATLAVAAPAALLAMKLHSIQDRRTERPEKEASDAEDIYRLISEHDPRGELAREVSLAPYGLPQLVLNAGQRVLVDGRRKIQRAFRVNGGVSARQIDLGDFSLVVDQFVSTLQRAIGL